MSEWLCIVNGTPILLRQSSGGQEGKSSRNSLFTHKKTASSFLSWLCIVNGTPKGI